MKESTEGFSAEAAARIISETDETEVSEKNEDSHYH